MTVKPSLGRIVHVMYEGHRYAAIIVHVWTDVCVNLNIFHSGADAKTDSFINNQMLLTSVTYDESHKNHTWHWPERV